CASGHSSGYIF
nr:immunoglobulin light chain junction region [Macaca mulatta]